LPLSRDETRLERTPVLFFFAFAMNTAYAGGCYLDSHTFLDNPRFFDETENGAYCIVDATLPTISSEIDSNFVLASLSYRTNEGRDDFLPGFYKIHTKVTYKQRFHVISSNISADHQFHSPRTRTQSSTW
jgi:hypothetical protein